MVGGGCGEGGVTAGKGVVSGGGKGRGWQGRRSGGRPALLCLISGSAFEYRKKNKNFHRREGGREGGTLDPPPPQPPCASKT